MKEQIASCARRLRMCRAFNGWVVVIVGLVMAGSLASAQAATYPVDVKGSKFKLYEDPYTGGEVRVGGFSGIYPVPGKKDKFYVISDRGANPDLVSLAGTFKIFLRPDFGPHIMTVHLQHNGTAKIIDLLPLKLPKDPPQPGRKGPKKQSTVTGLPNTLPPAEVPHDLNVEVVDNDEDGLDTEGLTIDPWGNFWVCEEYKPSVAMVAPNGEVQLRLVPAGTLTGLERIPTYDVLPGILTKRRNNRGFEGIAAASDGILYTTVQRPLNNPSQTVGNASQNIRIIAIDLNALFAAIPTVQIRQMIYRTEANVSPANVLLSDLFSVTPTTLLVPERRTDKLFLADLTGATDITPFEAPNGTLLSNPSLTIEQLDAAGLAALGITTIAKTVVLSSIKAIDPALDKVEGVCVVDNTLVLTHDNDFNLADPGATLTANPNPNGPPFELILQVPTNQPKVYTLPLP